ncbi:MAG: nucleotidyltransferase family protein [Pelagimonas sp.]|jgi:CTP:molybdopterin cytidylyltransferase MocA|nr:nucleotidyltransferase family protein [Pelagimonas sp.]
MQNIAILIPAAGASSRMRGRDKLLEEVDGLPLLRRQAKRAIFTGAHVCVTLPDHDHPRVHALEGLPVQIVAVPDADLGMSASLRRGIGMLPPMIDAVMILPADMPDLRTEDLVSVVETYQNSPFPALVQARTPDGTPGHPVLFPKDCFASLRQVTGDQGARDVLRAHSNRLRPVTLPGQRAVTDLDTPEAWAEWRQAKEQPVLSMRRQSVLFHDALH